jgi:hypothetical protein
MERTKEDIAYYNFLDELRVQEVLERAVVNLANLKNGLSDESPLDLFKQRQASKNCALNMSEADSKSSGLIDLYAERIAKRRR